MSTTTGNPAVFTSIISQNKTSGIRTDGMIEDADGNIWGTTMSGGTNNYGTVFEIKAGTNTLNTVAYFGDIGKKNGFTPEGTLVIVGSTLYGVTVNGGSASRGTVWSFNMTTNTLATVASFAGTNGGAHPEAGLVADADGNLYGTTFGGSRQRPTVFEITAASIGSGTPTITTLTSIGTGGGISSTPSTHISGQLAVDASTGLLEINNGLIYGTTQGGGTFTRGSIFTLNLNTGVASTLYSFDGTKGSRPIGTLLYVTNADEAGDNGLVGIASGGGLNSDGAIYKAALTTVNGVVTPVVTDLVNYNKTNGTRPLGTLLLVDPTTHLATGDFATGDIYGATASGGSNDSNKNGGFGSIYEIQHGTTGITRLTFGAFGTGTGIYPTGALILDPTTFSLIGATSKSIDGYASTIFTFPLSGATDTSTITISKQPTTGKAGVTLTNIVVQLRNSSGGIATTDNSSVTLTFATVFGDATLTGTMTVTAVNGVATFSGLSIDTKGIYTLLISADGYRPVQTKGITIAKAPVTPVPPALKLVDLDD